MRILDLIENYSNVEIPTEMLDKLEIKEGRWKANIDDDFYCIDRISNNIGCGYRTDKIRNCNINVTNNYYNSNNMFKTREEALEKARVMDIIEENKMTCDEINGAIRNDRVLFYIYYDTSTKKVYTSANYFSVNTMDYFKTKEIAEKVIAECEQNSLKKYYFGIWE